VAVKGLGMKSVFSTCFALVVWASLLLPQSSHAESVDREWVQSMYQNGELVPIKTRLQEVLKSRQSLTRSDSIFVYKYISVAIAADSGSKALAQSYMYKLLAVNPHVDIIDLYVSAGVYATFQEVKKEFLARSSYTDSQERIENNAPLSPPERTSATTSVPKSKPKIEEKKSRNNLVYWALGGVAISGAAALYVVSQKADDPKITTLSNEPASP
jgi:hypothetical protein